MHGKQRPKLTGLGTRCALGLAMIAAALNMNGDLSAQPASEVALVIAHRGASQVAPENTAAAIREAIRLGAKVIEFDVRVTRDRELVLFHDRELDRVAGRPGTIEASDWEEIRGLDVGSWFTRGSFAGEPLLRFDEALQICLEGGVTPLIEHKTGEAEEYVKVIREAQAVDRVIVQSFDWKFLRRFRELLPEVPIGALGSKPLDLERLGELRSVAPNWVGWNHADFGPGDVATLHELGAKIALWTVNDPEVARHWVQSGVQAIITDVPDRIAAALGPASGE